MAKFGAFLAQQRLNYEMIRVLAILSAIILHIAPIFLYKSASLTWCRQKAQKTEENTGAGVRAMSSGANFENPQPETVGSPTDRVFEG